MAGRIVRCKTPTCTRVTRMIGGDGSETWQCDGPCPHVPKPPRTFGQPKGAKKK